MKISYFGIGLILIGALIFGAAYAGYPLTIVTVGNSFTVSVPSTISMPSSTSPIFSDSFRFKRISESCSRMGYNYNSIK